MFVNERNHYRDNKNNNDNNRTNIFNGDLINVYEMRHDNIYDTIHCTI